jgi:CRP/FNR family transcriptional regulator
VLSSGRCPRRRWWRFLTQCAAFAGLPTREIEALARVALEERHRARSSVFMEGDPARWFYLVKTGHVKIVRHSKTGKDVVLELLGPGEVFGGVAVIEKRAYPAAAEATESTVVVKIPADPMIALADRHPSFIREMARLIGRRLRAAHDSVTSLAVDPVEARLAAALVRLAEREGTRGKDGVTLPFHLTRQSLADMTGTTVETTIRVIGRWLKEGLLRGRRRPPRARRLGRAPGPRRGRAALGPRHSPGPRGVEGLRCLSRRMTAVIVASCPPRYRRW